MNSLAYIQKHRGELEVYAEAFFFRYLIDAALHNAYSLIQ